MRFSRFIPGLAGFWVLFTALIVAPGFQRSARAVPVTIDSSTMINGYMVVSDLPSAGGSYIFGSGWNIADLNATFTDTKTVNFTPNTIGDPNPFWYTPSGGPGATGNKIMAASLYAEDNSLFGQTVVFEGDVTNFTLVSGWTFSAFVRDYASDYSTFVETVVPITGAGSFTATLATTNDPTRHVWYGLEMIGPCVWITDVASKGSVTVTAGTGPSPVPEIDPAGMGSVLALVTGAIGLIERRRQKVA